MRVNIARLTTFSYLKPKQVDSLVGVMRGGDTVTILPTRYGKSLVFELIPFIFDIRQTGQIPHSILIFSPFDVIMKDQLRRYGHKQAIEITRLSLQKHNRPS